MLVPWFANKQVILAYEEDGKPLPQADGFARLIVPGDQAIGRFVSNVIELQVVSLRNIVVRGCALSQLAGRTFRIGTATLRGLALRKSADVSLENIQPLPSQESVGQAAHCLVLPRPDLRAAVLTEGTISVGDRIEIT